MNEEDYIEQINNLIERCGIGFDLDDIKALDFLLKQNKQLKGSLQTYEIVLKANVEENQKLKADYGNKAQVERDLLLEENKRLKDKINKVSQLLQLLHYKFDDNDVIHYEIEDIQKILKE